MKVRIKIRLVKKACKANGGSLHGLSLTYYLRYLTTAMQVVTPKQVELSCKAYLVEDGVYVLKRVCERVGGVV